MIETVTAGLCRRFVYAASPRTEAQMLTLGAVPLPPWLPMHWLPPTVQFPPIDDHHAVRKTQRKGVLWIDFDQIGAYDELARVFTSCRTSSWECPTTRSWSSRVT